MGLGFKEFLKGIRLVPVSSSGVSKEGDIEVLDSNGKLNYHNGSSASPMVTEAHAATLTNKVISGASNTLSNINISSLVSSTPSRLIASNASNVIVTTGVTYNVDDSISFISGILASPSIKMGPNATGFFRDTSVGGDTINFVQNGLLTGSITWQTYPSEVTWVLGNNSLLAGLAISGPRLSLNSSDFSVQQDNSITGGNNFADTLTLTADTQPDASQGGVIKLYARSASLPHVTEFYNSGILSGSINSSGQLRWSSGGVGGPGYGFASFPTTGMYAEAGPLLSWTVAGTKLMSLSSGGALTVGASGGAGSSIFNGFLTVQGTGTGQFTVADTVDHTLTGAPRMTFKASATTLGTLGFPTANTNKLVYNSNAASGSHEFQVNSVAIGGADQNGKFTLGSVGGLQIHQINGGLATTQAVSLAEIATPSTPASGNGKIYFKSDGFLYQLNDDGTETKVGAGTGGVNYITNGDAESNTTGWATYADAAGSVPVDGTGGSANVTFTRSASSPLRGTGSFLLTKDAADRQGQGASYDFTIADADKAKPLFISFDYTISSGTFVAGDSSDVRVFLYDVTNAQLIQPAPYTIQGGAGSNHRFLGTFQTSSNSNSYRLIFHVATTSTSAYVLKIDDVEIGPQSLNYGSPVTDWVASSATGSLSTNTTYTVKTKRIGDTLKIAYNLAFSGSPGTYSSITLNLPSGYIIDTSKLVNTSNMIVGHGSALRGSNNWYFDCFYSTTTSVIVTNYRNSGGYIDNAAFTDTIPTSNFTSGDKLVAEITVPIVGWSSTVEMSNDTDTRVCAARANTSTTTINNTTPVVIFTATDYDTHGAYNSSNGRFTAPVSGKYQVSTSLRFNSQSYGSGNVIELYVYKNGSQYSILDRITSTTITAVYMIDGSDTIILNAGDYIDIRAYNDVSTAVTSATGNHFAVERVSGPSAIAASEKIVARYNSNNTDTIPNGTNTIVDFEDRVIDTHSAVTIGASWRFTAPMNAYYRVSSLVESAAGGGWSNGELWGVRLYKNGNGYSYLGIKYYETTGSIAVSGGSDVIQLNAGDYIDIRIFQTSGASIGTGNNPEVKYVCIESV